MRMSYEMDGITYVLTGMSYGVAQYKPLTGRK